VRAAVLTVSDSCVAGTRTDESGPFIRDRLVATGWDVVATAVVPDERGAIAAILRGWADELGVDLVLTTGGTGFSTRDVTPEATGDVVERRAPGLAEALRAEGMKVTERACLSRAEAGLRGRTLIVNLPGSLKAVRDGMTFLERLLPHAVQMIAGGGHG
jgi:molybdopterin adenylyltransferase